MQFFGFGGAEQLWRLPAVGGLLVVGLAVLLILFPVFFAYFVAVLLIATGLSLLGVAWRMRRSVTYRRIEPQWRVHDEGDKPGA